MKIDKPKLPGSSTGTTTLDSANASATDYIATFPAVTGTVALTSSSITGSAGSVKSNATTGVMQIAGPATGTTRVMTVPDADFTAVTTATLNGGTLPASVTSLFTTGGPVFLKTANVAASNGLILVATAKATAGLGSSGTIKVYSDDAANQLQGGMTLVTSATAGDRKLFVEAIEQGVAYRDVHISPNGGNVQLGYAAGTVSIPGTLSAGATSVTTLGASGDVTVTNTAAGQAKYVITSSSKSWCLLIPGSGWSPGFVGLSAGYFGLRNETDSVDVLHATPAGAVSIPGSLSVTSASGYALSLVPSGTGASALFVNLPSGTTGYPIVAQTNSVNMFVVDSAGNATVTGLMFSGKLGMPLSTPATSGATGQAGQAKWDASYIYICTATNTWKRVALSTF